MPSAADDRSAVLTGGEQEPGGWEEAPDAEALFAPLAGLGRVGLAVSGGSDSTALMVLFERWSRAGAERPPGVVLTVDHGLRPEAAGEAEAVAEGARARGLDAHVLMWRHGPIVGDLQAKAREARYRLLAEAARRLGLDAVLLAHTADDVAETFVMRLARGAGLAGLSAMAGERCVHGVRFLRPFRKVGRQRLRGLLSRDGIDWIDDPSNGNDRFLRVRIRRALPGLEALGLGRGRLVSAAFALGEAAEVVADAIDALDARAVENGAGWCRLDLSLLAAARPIVAKGLLSRLITDIRPAPYPADHDAVAGLLSRALSGLEAGTTFSMTLGGVVAWGRGTAMTLAPEAGRQGFPTLSVAGEARLVWDGRFELALDAALGATDIRPVDAAGRRLLAEEGIALPARLAGGLPMACRGGEIVALPLARDGAGQGRLQSAGGFRLRALKARFE